MTPMLKLGPWDSPAIEFMPRDVEPLVILMIQSSDLSPTELESAFNFASLNTLHLDAESVGFFVKLEGVCRRVLAGELTHYSVIKIKNSEFVGLLDRGWNTGEITSGVKAATQRFLDFLAANPEYWPFKN